MLSAHGKYQQSNDLGISYYTKHRVLLWNRVCSAFGLKGLLGASKRRILSFAEAVVPLTLGAEVEAAIGVPLVVGAGMLTVAVSPMDL